MKREYNISRGFQKVQNIRELVRGVFLVLIFFIFLPSLCAREQESLKSVTLQLQWKYQFQFAGFIVAKEQGYYSEIGLDVDIREYSPDIDTIDNLLLGDSEYAIMNTPLAYRDGEIKPLVLLASYIQKNPLVFAVRPEITNPIQLKGKRVMGTKENLYSSPLALMLDHFGVNSENSDLITHKLSISPFIDGEVDAITIFRSNEPFELREKDIKYNILDPYDYGFYTTAINLFTTQKYAKTNPQEIRDFLRATKRGWEYALANIEEVALLIHTKYNPEKSVDSLIYEGSVTKNLMLRDVYEIGHIDSDLVERTYKQLITNKTITPQKDLKKLTLQTLEKKEASNQIDFTQEELDYLLSIEKIRMCIDPNWMPFEKNDNGEHIGMSADYFALLEERIGVSIEMVPTKSWSESLEIGKRRECDIFSLVMPTKERREFLDFTDPYLVIPLVIATGLGVPFIPDIGELVGKEVGIVKGYAYKEILKESYPLLNLVEVENVDDGLKQVDSGRLFGFIGTLATIGQRIQQHYIGSLKITGKFDETWDLGVGTRNDVPILHQIFNKAILSISESEHQQIMNRWIAIKYEEEFDYGLLLKISLAFLLLLFGMYVWNRSLSVKVENALKAYKKQQILLQQHSKMADMGSMMQAILHQWKQPLATISLQTDLIEVELEDKNIEIKEIFDATKIIQEQIGFMIQTAIDFRNFHKEEKERVPFMVCKLATKVSEMFAGEFQKANVTITIHPHEHFEIYGYPNEFIQVILNLFKNAKEAIEEKGVKDGRIDCYFSKNENEATIKIEDNGGGIPKDLLPEMIFEAQISTKGEKGSGIGLQISREIIKQSFGGTLEASNTQKGALFTVKIPIYKNESHSLW